MARPTVTSCIHGRFQPFHNGHLAYLKAICDRSEILFIGIANADPSHITADVSAPHRHLDDANPFTYYQRMEMILLTLQAENLHLERFRFIPFPINRPDLIKYYVPPEAVHYLCVFDDWSQRKTELLRREGLEVVGLTGMPKLACGTDIRERMRSGRSIRHLVPESVEKHLARVGFLR